MNIDNICYICHYDNICLLEDVTYDTVNVSYVDENIVQPLPTYESYMNECCTYISLHES